MRLNDYGPRTIISKNKYLNKFKIRSSYYLSDVTYKAVSLKLCRKHNDIVLMEQSLLKLITNSNSKTTKKLVKQKLDRQIHRGIIVPLILAEIK